MLTVGSVVCGYRIQRVLGSGGMGAVYLAADPTLPRYIALKVLSAELSRDPDFRARFVREADTAAALEHPQIVSVYNRGQTDDGQLWIAMQFVDGTDADAALRAGTMTPQRAVHIISEVAKAIARVVWAPIVGGAYGLPFVVGFMSERQTPGADPQMSPRTAAGVDYVSTSLTTVYQAKDRAGAQTLAQSYNEADTKNPAAQPASAVPGLPQSRCTEVAGTGGLMPRYRCLATAGRYTIKATARQLDNAHKQIAAQYLILTG